MKQNSNEYCWPSSFDLADPLDRIRALANWQSLRYRRLGPDPDEQAVPPRAPGLLDYTGPICYDNRVRGMPLEESISRWLAEGPFLWQDYLRLNREPMLEASRDALLSATRGSTETLDRIVRFLLSTDLDQGKVSPDLDDIESIIPKDVEYFRKGLMTRREFNLKAITACRHTLTTLLAPGNVVQGSVEAFMVGEAMTEGLWRGMHVVGCRDIFGWTTAAAWTYRAPLDGEPGDHDRQYQVFYCHDDVLILARLLAGGTPHLLTHGRLMGLGSEVLSDLDGDRDWFAEELYQAIRTHFLHHEVGHHFQNIQPVTDFLARGEQPSATPYAEWIINELMAELFALKEAVREGDLALNLQRLFRSGQYLRFRRLYPEIPEETYSWVDTGWYQVFVLGSLLGKEPVGTLEGHVENFRKALAKFPEMDSYAAWVLQNLKAQVKELDRHFAE